MVSVRYWGETLGMSEALCSSLTVVAFCASGVRDIVTGEPRLLVLLHVNDRRLEDLTERIDEAVFRSSISTAHETFYLTPFPLSLPKLLPSQVNVVGTRNIMQACKKFGVQRLVYTSTMDVVCWRNHETIAALDDELSIPPRPEDFLYGHYATTKAQVGG